MTESAGAADLFTLKTNARDATDPMTTTAVKKLLCRTGSLFSNHVATPCYVPPTIVGSMPHLTPDNCKKFPELKAQVINFADIFSSLEFVKKNNMNFREFMNTNDYKLMLSARDYVNEPETPVTSKAGFMIEHARGRRAVATSDLMEVASLLEPELLMPLADEINCSYGNNRQRASVQTTLNWLDECLQSSSEKTKFPVCGVIVGGADERARVYSTEETCKRSIDAVMISGLDSCEDTAKRQELLSKVIDTITPSSLPRLMSGIGHPLDVLDAISTGVDAFVSMYPATVTKQGSAIIWWMDAKDNSEARTQERETAGSVLHLREKRFEKDFRPLLDGCDCFACQHYTRAYVHHLLNVREMLGDILVYMHNLHQYYRFFTITRAHIDANSFVSFQTQFTAQYEEKKSTAPPLAIPMAIKERRKQKEEEKQVEKQQKAEEAAAKHAANKRKRHEIETENEPVA